MNKQIKGPGSAPSFARATGKPNSRQLACGSSTAPSKGQTKMPAYQGGRSEGSKKS